MPVIKERLSVNYKDLSSKYLIKNVNYNRQYYNIYLVRLKKMREKLMVLIKNKWSNTYPIVRLHEISESNSEKYIVIGTLFKNQKFKPSVLKQLAESNQLLPQPTLTHFTDQSDQLFIEDELQRYQLIGGLDVNKLVTGITVAILGHANTVGHFYVDDWLFSGCESQIPRPLLENDAFLVIMSGLNLVHAQNSLLNLHLFADWLMGLDECDDMINKITRLVIAGNSINTNTESKKSSVSLISRTQVNESTLSAVKLFDQMLARLAECIDVDVMPGEHDPSNQLLPQQPMHSCLFPVAAHFNSTNRVPNPYAFSLDGVHFIGHSGQPIQDILRFTDGTNAMEILENCLKWGHLAPTAPDTLDCYPYYDKDPFILDELPHVIFAGNQQKFDTKIIHINQTNSIRLICVPEFTKTHEICLINLKTLDCKTINFNY